MKRKSDAYVVTPPELQAEARALAEQHGAKEAAALIGMAVATFARLMAGLPVQRATVSHFAAGIAQEKARAA